MSRAIGNAGEDIALKFILNKGYQVLCKNYRYKRAEVDIVARDGEKIMFIEVKLRNHKSYGLPESFVGDDKLDLYALAAEHYIAEMSWQGELRFDVIAIYGSIDRDREDFEIKHFEDVYYPEE